MEVLRAACAVVGPGLIILALLGFIMNLGRPGVLDPNNVAQIASMTLHFVLVLTMAVIGIGLLCVALVFKRPL